MLEIVLLTKMVDQCKEIIKNVQFKVTSVKNDTDCDLDAEVSLLSVQLHHQPLTLSAAGYLDIDFGFVQSVSSGSCA